MTHIIANCPDERRASREIARGLAELDHKYRRRLISPPPRQRRLALLRKWLRMRKLYRKRIARKYGFDPVVLRQNADLAADMSHRTSAGS